ncbi:MAG: HEPN domain-containing protein [Acidobacteria bacterium]|nr:HEPN domain-containing protein [Acidobacteriota bacterium]
MPHDEVRAGDTRAWLDQAAKDLRRVEILLATAPPDVEGALFHSQQAAEKALKGFLTWHDIAFRWVHELGEIGRQCLQADPTLTELLQRANSLTKYAVRFRYPGAPYQPTVEEAHAAHALAREVADAIMSRLPEEARA